MKKLTLVFLAAIMLSAGCSAPSATSTQVEKVAVPDFALPNIDGNMVQLSSYKDKSPVLIVFWATWCPYCVQEMPNLVKLQRKHGDKLKILAIDIQESRSKVASFASKHNIDLTILLDEEGEVSASYGLVGVPTLVLIGRDGMGVTADNGLTPDMLEAIEQSVS